MGMKLLIAGGGTGGHVFPAMAIAREWLSRGSEREVVLVGTQRGIEMKLVPQAGLPLETLRVAGLKGKGGARCAKNLAKLAPAMLDAARVLRKHRARRGLWSRRLRRRADDAGHLAARRAQRDLRAECRAGFHQQSAGAHFDAHRHRL